MRFFFLFIYIIFFGALTFAQDESVEQRIKKQVSDQSRKSGLIAGMEMSTTAYIDAVNKDSNDVAPYLALQLDYHHKTNIGLKVKSYSLLKGSSSRNYLSSFTVYYANYLNQVIPVISYTRHWQHSDLLVPYSPIQNELYAQGRLTSHFIEPYAGIGFGFGIDKYNADEQVTDLNAFAGMSHLFQWLPGNKGFIIALSPSVQLNAGTDKYYSYLRNSRYISRNMSSGSLGGRQRMGGRNESVTMTEPIVDESNKFGLSNFESNLYLAIG
ncbi:MAG TPA: hypothetical protein VGD33_02725, partial [Chitinophagaceae bacterium]